MRDLNVSSTQLKRSKKFAKAILVVVIVVMALPTYIDPGAAAAHTNGPAIAPVEESEIRSVIVKPIENLPLVSESGPESFSFSSQSQAQSKIDVPLPLNLVSYSTQPGDTLRSIAHRFDVSMGEIFSRDGYPIDNDQLLDPNVKILIPRHQRETSSSNVLLPDSEIVYSPSSINFDVNAFVNKYGGYLTKYREFVDGTWMSGPEVVARAALDNSISPRLLLAILEYRSGWVTNEAISKGNERLFPIWQRDPRLQGLYLQLMWAADELSEAYYGWREGTVLQLHFPDGTDLDIAPELNAGSVAIQHLISRFSSRTYWPADLQEHPLMQIYEKFFGDPRDFEVPLYDIGISQPEMILPFPESNHWIFTGGPHGAWGSKSARAALDFAPQWDTLHRSSNKEILSVADGVIARLDQGIIVLDLDGDGYEQTGWSIQYLHVIASDSVTLGERVSRGQMLGYASIEGGVAHGVHLHIARKYNGEWIQADGPLPFELGGWRVRAGSQPYDGVLYIDGTDLLGRFCSSKDIRFEIDRGEVVELLNPLAVSGCNVFPESVVLRNNPDSVSNDF